MSGSSQNSSTTNTLDPTIKGLILGNANRAQSIANLPFQPYGGQGYAPLSQNQNYAIQGAQNLNQAGAPNLDMAAQGAGGILSGINPNPVAGMAAYSNPYTDQVVNSTLNDIDLQRQRAIMGNDQSATSAGAFGGSRHGVADALTNEAYGRTAATTAAGLRSQGFDTAAGLAQNDASRGLSAASTLGNIGNSQFSNALNYVGALGTTGGMAQQNQQGQNTFDYNEFLRSIAYPGQGQTLLNQSLGLLPQSGTTSGTTSMNPGALGILGGVGSLGLGLGALSSNSVGGRLLNSWFS